MASKLNGEGKVQHFRKHVSGHADVLLAAQLSKQLANAVGFSKAYSDEIGLVVTELATNLIRHAGCGVIQLSQIHVGERSGLEIQSTDSGPGIPNLQTALRDGFSTVGGLGYGLGAVNRLTDGLEIAPRPGGGLKIICRRWLPTQMSAAAAGGLAFGAATRSFGHLPENGDAYLIKQWGRRALVAVIDGLGHGPFAQLAAQTARAYLEGHCEQTLENLFRGTGQACRPTRGVVMALACFDLAAQQVKLASVGNIEVRISGQGRRTLPTIQRGIVGLHAAKPVMTEHEWTSNSLLIMHSDGVRTDWDLDHYRNEVKHTPNVIAQRLLNELGRTDDDATVVVARGNV